MRLPRWSAALATGGLLAFGGATGTMASMQGQSAPVAWSHASGFPVLNVVSAKTAALILAKLSGRVRRVRMGCAAGARPVGRHVAVFLDPSLRAGSSRRVRPAQPLLAYAHINLGRFR
jgi:hypothetical protein